MKTKRILGVSWGIMTVLALGMALVASRYFSLNPDVFFPQQRDIYVAHQVGIMAHIVGGVLALGLGPFQFLKRLRTQWLQVHRWIGRFYLPGILLGGTAGLYMAFYAYAGMAASLGFATLAVLWLVTGFMGYRTVRARESSAHGDWMVRNFALTFAAVTLRLWLPLLTVVFGATTGYEIVAWLCWIPNLVVAEAIVQARFRRQKPRAISPKATDVAEMGV
jgi:hypothetical protein